MGIFLDIGGVGSRFSTNLKGQCVSFLKCFKYGLREVLALFLH